MIPYVLLLIPAFGLLVAPVTAKAQAPEKVWQLAVLTGAISRSDPPAKALEQRLVELGYVQGRNLVIDFQTAAGQPDRLDALAAELIGRRPDVLVAVSTQSAIAAKNATQTIPIVLGAVGDPVGSGIVPNLGRPGGNITGASLLNAELSGKSLQLLERGEGRTRDGPPNLPGSHPNRLPRRAARCAPRRGWAERKRRPSCLARRVSPRQSSFLPYPWFLKRLRNRTWTRHPC